MRGICPPGGVLRPVPARRLPLGVEDTIADAYQSGSTLEELARHYRVASETIRRVLDQAGVPRRRPGRRRHPLPSDEAIAAAYRGGATMPELAATFGCSLWPIRAALDRQDEVERRVGRPRASRGREGEIAAAYQAGETIAVVAERYQISKRTVVRIAEAHGVRRPRYRRAASNKAAQQDHFRDRSST